MVDLDPAGPSPHLREPEEREVPVEVRTQLARTDLRPATREA